VVGSRCYIQDPGSRVLVVAWRDEGLVGEFNNVRFE